MATFYDQLPSAQVGGFFSQLPSQGRAMVFQPSVEDMFRDELANTLARADATRTNRRFAVDPQTGQYPLDAAGLMQLEPAPGFSEQDISKQFDSLYSAFPMVDPRASRASSNRVVGSADRGYSLVDTKTGEVSDIIPGRSGVLSDIDKARIRTIESRRRDIQRAIDQLYEGHPDLPALQGQLQQLEGLLNQMGITNAVPMSQEAPPPPMDQGAAAPQESGGFWDALNFDSLPGILEQLGDNAGSRLSTVGQNVRNLPSTVGGNLGEAYGNFRRNIGFPIENQPAPIQPQQQLQQFQSEAEALAAGIPPGQPFMLFDPATRRFRRAIIE